jgi:hypothetical protein
MTIKEMIAELQKYPNQDAEVNLMVNTTNVEDEVFDTEHCEIAFMEQDKEDCSIYDIMVYKDNQNHNQDDCLMDLLYTKQHLKVELNANEETIIVKDNNDNVLRTIICDDRFRPYENVLRTLRDIL